jgi:uncharacterized metal-binding protein YceD (DUF177 family)
MIIDLTACAPDNPIEREIERDSMDLDFTYGDAVLKSMRSWLRFRNESIGYALDYRLSARAIVTCVRCGGELNLPIVVRSSVALRTKHPQSHNVTLSRDELDVRFIRSEDFDIDAFIAEIADLALPDYPRHTHGDPACQLPAAEDDGASNPDSPFAGLSRHLPGAENKNQAE